MASLFLGFSTGPVAQWITRLTTDQEIPGSNPGRFDNFSRRVPCSDPASMSEPLKNAHNKWSMPQDGEKKTAFTPQNCLF